MLYLYLYLILESASISSHVLHTMRTARTKSTPTPTSKALMMISCIEMVPWSSALHSAAARDQTSTLQMTMSTPNGHFRTS